MCLFYILGLQTRPTITSTTHGPTSEETTSSSSGTTVSTVTPSTSSSFSSTTSTRTVSTTTIGTTESSDFPTASTSLSPQCSALVDIHFLLDASSSISLQDWQKQIMFLKNFANSFKIGVNEALIGVTTFSTMPMKIFDIKDHKDILGLLSAIDGLPYSGG